VSNLTRSEKYQLQANARAFLDRPYAPDLCAQLYDALLTDANLRDLAFLASAERFVATQEAWASAVGARFAETVRAAFRAAERDMRESMQQAQNAVWRAEDERDQTLARQSETETKMAHFCAVFGDPPHIGANGRTE
jgi:hypothetical protein